MQTLNLKELFKTQGKLDLLENYRGQIRPNRSAVESNIQFIIICAVWFAIVFSISVGAAFAMLNLVPFILEYTLLPLTKIINPDFANQAFVLSVQVLKTISPIVTVLAFIPFNAMFLVLLERKLLSVLTRRLGPNRVGYNGILQTFVDAIKLLFKEDTVPRGSDKVLFFLAPAIFFGPSILVFLPILSVAAGGLGPYAAGSFTGNLIYIFAIASLSILGLVLAGYASNSKYSLLGGLRSVAQAISYEIPLVLTVVALVLIIGSLNILEINEMQSGGLFAWNIFGAGILTKLGGIAAKFQAGSIISGILAILFSIVQLALLPILALLLYGSFLAETNRIPFDLPEAESELVSGFNTEYSGMKFALFFLAEYTNLFVASALFAILFLGGTSSGIPGLDSLEINLLSNTPFGNLSWLPGAKILLLKTYIMISVAIWIRATLPRFRSDQLMSLAWKALIPASLVIVLIAALCRVFLAGVS